MVVMEELVYAPPFFKRDDIVVVCVDLFEELIKFRIRDDKSHALECFTEFRFVNFSIMIPVNALKEFPEFTFSSVNEDTKFCGTRFRNCSFLSPML